MNPAFDAVLAAGPDAMSSAFDTTALRLGTAAEGFEGAKLAYLAQAAGFFYDRHRAMNDCLATIELLASQSG